jgi:predicted porin
MITKKCFALFLSAGLLAQIPAQADEDVAKLPEGMKVYGKLNVSAQHDLDYDFQKTHKEHHRDWNFKWHSNASRLGAKGKTSLTDDLSVVYKAEYEIDANDGYGGEKDFVGMREVYAGISSETYGTVEGGKIDTPLKMLQGKVDLFGDLVAADAKYLIQGKNRDSFTYLYKTPVWSGFQVAAATIDFKRLDNESSKPQDQRGSSMSLAWTGEDLLMAKDSLYVAVARDNGVRDMDSNRLAVQYKFSDFTLGAILQDSHRQPLGKTFPTGDRDEDGYILNAAWKITDKGTVKTQWGRSQQREKDGSLFAVGYDHQLRKDLKLYVYHGEIGGDEVASSKSDRTLQTTGVGVEYNFDLFTL